jgi:hypothetical protein
MFLHLAAASSLPAAEPPPAAAPSAFTLGVMSQETAPGVSVTALVATTPSNRFTFLPPPTWRYLAVPTESKVRIVAPNPEVIIAIAFREDGASETNLLSAESAKSMLTQSFPESRVREEFPAMALGRPAVGFDIEWRGANGSRQVARVAYARFPGGVLEACLTAPPADIARYHHPLNALLLSVRRSALTGKLMIQNVRPE